MTALSNSPDPRPALGRLTAPIAVVVVTWGCFASIGLAADPPGIVRSVTSGPWSAAATWSTKRVPAAGDHVQIRTGHRVVYDVESDAAIRAIHVAGTLAFAADRDTRLDVGLVRIEAGDDWKEGGFDCHHIPTKPHADAPRPALEVGTPDQPIPAEHRALIRLVYFEGEDKNSLPAIVCCAGRMDIHGAPLRRTWVKLARPATVNETRLYVSEDVSDWRVGDRVVVTATARQRPFAGHATAHVTDAPASEVRTLKGVDAYFESVLHRERGGRMVLEVDDPLKHPHRAEPGYAGEVANLSRNVVIESADPAGVRGHTMYHRHSTGSISYAEFRHLGKKGVLGRYPVHYHLVGDTMRGSSVVGASVWDSHNRWVTIHGTQYLVVRDCVGYRSVGHGYFLEDGTEVFNVLDRNLAIQALVGEPLLYLPIHIVWMELIIHPTALLVFQQAAPDGPLTAEQLHDGPKGGRRFFTRPGWAVIFGTGALMTLLLLLAYQQSLEAGADHARSVALVALVSAGAATAAILSRLRGRIAWLVTSATLLSAVVLVEIPALAAILHLTSLHLEDWLAAVLGGAAAASPAALLNVVGRGRR